MLNYISVCNIHLENLNKTYTVRKKYDRVSKTVSTVVCDGKKKNRYLPCVDVKWEKDESGRMFVVTITPCQNCDAVPSAVLTTSDYFTLSFQHDATLKLGRKKLLNINSKFFAPIVRVDCIPSYQDTKFPGNMKRVNALPQPKLFDCMFGEWSPLHVHVTRIRHSLRLHTEEDRQLRIPFFEDHGYIHQIPEHSITDAAFEKLVQGNMQVQKEFYERRLEEQRAFLNDTESDEVSGSCFLLHYIDWCAEP